MKYLLDTDICIHVFRGHPGIIAKITNVAADELAVSSVTVYELLCGATLCVRERQLSEMRKVETFLRQIHQLPFGLEAARRAAQVRAELERSGRGIGPMDTLIAATALEADLILVTRNLEEFSRVSGLRCESW